jgi:diguanylate cyclase (GGDEF)-like protein
MEPSALIASWGAFLIAGCAFLLADRMRTRRFRLRERLIEARERDIRTVARDLIGASRVSRLAVCRVLDQAVRSLAPSIDAVLFTECEHDTLRCTYASGKRVEYFRGARLSPERDDSPLIQAMTRRHRVASRGLQQAAVPGDRAFLAVPMLDNAETIGVFYVASTSVDAFDVEDSIMTLVELAVSTYQLARDREIDREKATIDALTGLLTPAFFRMRLTEALANTATHRLSLLYIDADNFKPCNDTFGHSTGDIVLRAFADILHANAGPEALVGRNGGDEFCVLLLGVSKTEAIDCAEHLRKAVQNYAFDDLLEGKRLARPITASIGVAAFPADARTTTALLKAADEAMYHGKQRGRNRVAFYDVAGQLAETREQTHP